MKIVKPPRKTNKNHAIDKFLVNINKPNKLISRKVTTPHGIITTGIIYGSNGIDYARVGTLLSHFKGKKSLISECKIIDIVPLKQDLHDNHDVQMILYQIENKNEMKQYAEKTVQILSKMASEECVGIWKYSIPSFVFSGDHTPPRMRCLQSFVSEEKYANILSKIRSSDDIF